MTLPVGVFLAVLVFLAILGVSVYIFLIKKKSKKSSQTDPEAVGESMLTKADSNGGCGEYVNGNGEHSVSALNDNSSAADNIWDGKLLEGGSVTIPMEVLRQITNDFSEDNILGKGGFGVVYLGKLVDGTKVAVKRMSNVALVKKGLKFFENEIAVLTKVKHTNLVALLGYCVNGDERLLVYEYMPQGDLGHHLFEWREHGYSPLTWRQRVIIALDVALGVECLHSFPQQSSIHRDLKPPNILLGNDMRAKVADFGLVKIAVDGKYSNDSDLRGTFGYLAPEYTSTGKSTAKVDVFAFGVVLMEMITGRKAFDKTMPDDKIHLATWFCSVLKNKDILPQELDQTLKPDEETLESIHWVAELAGHCTAFDPEQRLDMGQAICGLRQLVETWKPSHQDQALQTLSMGLDQATRRFSCQEVVMDKFMCWLSIRKQIHYYFSEENLIADRYLCGIMNDQGFVQLCVIAYFRRIANLTNSIQTIVEALKGSPFVEVQGDKIRKRHNWQDWLLPKRSSPAQSVKRA